MAEVKVNFRFLENGWRNETRYVEDKEVSAPLEGSTVVSCDFSGWSSAKSLNGVVLKLKDGRKCTLSEENEPSWEGSSVGWINIDVDEEW